MEASWETPAAAGELRAAVLPAHLCSAPCPSPGREGRRVFGSSTGVADPSVNWWLLAPAPCNLDRAEGVCESLHMLQEKTQTVGRAQVGLNWCFALWQSPLRPKIFFKERGGSACYLLGLPEMTDNFSSCIASTEKRTAVDPSSRLMRICVTRSDSPQLAHSNLIASLPETSGGWVVSFSCDTCLVFLCCGRLYALVTYAQCVSFSAIGFERFLF